MDYDTACIALRAFLLGLLVAGAIWVFTRPNSK